MRKMKFWLLGIILALIYSCSDDFEGQRSQEIDVSEARAYFEKNATDLAPLTFKNPLSRASSFVVPELIPEWDEAIESENEDYFITEVPLHSQSNAICVERVIKDAEFFCEKKILCQRRLVIARQKDSEETDMFVATLVPDDDFVGGEGTPFTGRVFYSELNGDFRKARRYKEGQIGGNEQIKKAVSCAVCTREGAPLDYSTLTFQEGQTSRSATYSNSESGGGGWYPGWGGGGTGGGSIGGGGTGGGSIGGGGTGGGSTSGSSDYQRGIEAFDTMTENMINGRVQMPCLRYRNTGYDVVNGFSIGVNTNGIIASCISFMNQQNLGPYAASFGVWVGGIGAIMGVTQTIIAFSDSNIPNPGFWEIASNVLGTLGFVCNFIPCLVPLGAVLGIASCVIGLVTTVGVYAEDMLLKIPLEDGSNMYIFIPATVSSIA
ncbi:hypothetical protein AALK14_09020 [Butyricimonas hominis]|uniref:hypothetical protein n=1 Tax=Butyricimonas TaxID=574697 RepID=UPI003517BE04